MFYVDCILSGFFCNDLSTLLIGASFDLSTVRIEDGFLPCQLCLEGKAEW